MCANRRVYCRGEGSCHSQVAPPDILPPPLSHTLASFLFLAKLYVQQNAPGGATTPITRPHPTVNKQTLFWCLGCPDRLDPSVLWGKIFAGSRELEIQDLDFRKLAASLFSVFVRRHKFSSHLFPSMSETTRSRHKRRSFSSFYRTQVSLVRSLCPDVTHWVSHVFETLLMLLWLMKIPSQY